MVTYEEVLGWFPVDMQEVAWLEKGDLYFGPEGRAAAKFFSAENGVVASGVYQNIWWGERDKGVLF